MSVRSVWLAAFLASLAVLAFAIWFQVSMGQHWTRVPLPYGLASPVLVMELPKEPWPSSMLDAGENRAEMSHQQYIDYGYIPSYTLLFIFVAVLQSYSTRQWVWALAPLCVMLALTAATYDLVENRGILAVTELRDDSAWALIRPAALVKWACAYLVILFQAPFYLTVSLRGLIAKIIARAVGLLALASGAVGFYSSVTGNEKGIGMALLPLLVATLAMPLFFWLGRRNA